MATPKIIADFETSLATALAIGGTSFTLASATDDDGVALPNGLYYFTVDNGTSNKEYLAGTLAGTSVTSVLSVSRQGAETSGAARAHRVGASVIMTDFATYKKYMDEIALVSAPDASTSAKGVVEAATTAEIDADTATGSTGAIIAVAPDKLVLSKYGTRLPTADQKAALAGVSGTPSSLNPYFTKQDTRVGIRQYNAGATINGGTLPVPVYQSKSDNEFYACDANDTNALKFLGFAISNSTDGASMDIQFNGVVTGFTGLAEGEKYYVQDTVGTIGTTPGTYEVLVGIAISETELMIQKGRRRAAGVSSQADAGVDETTTNVAITTGFRPNIIRLHTMLDVTQSDYPASPTYGTWINGVYASIYNSVVGAAAPNTGNTTSYLANAYAGSTEQWQVTVTSVTDTGFTLTFLQKETTPPTLFYHWEAEGEL